MTLARALRMAVKEREPVLEKNSSVSSDLPQHLKLGRLGEDAACEYLKSAGYVILARNISYRCGEIDIIARDNDEIVFVEVRTRSIGIMTPPEATVGPNKLSKLVKSARIWTESTNYRGFWRIDLIAITSANRKLCKIEHIKNITEAIL